MSQVAETSLEEIGEVVEYRSSDTEKVHRPDPDADEPRPACPQSGAARGQRGYRRVAFEIVRSHRELCQNPECYGSDWR